MLLSVKLPVEDKRRLLVEKVTPNKLGAILNVRHLRMKRFKFNSLGDIYSKIANCMMSSWLFAFGCSAIFRSAFMCTCHPSKFWCISYLDSVTS